MYFNVCSSVHAHKCSGICELCAIWNQLVCRVSLVCRWSQRLGSHQFSSCWFVDWNFYCCITAAVSGVEAPLTPAHSRNVKTDLLSLQPIDAATQNTLDDRRRWYVRLCQSSSATLGRGATVLLFCEHQTSSLFILTTWSSWLSTSMKRRYQPLPCSHSELQHVVLLTSWCQALGSIVSMWCGHAATFKAGLDPLFLTNQSQTSFLSLCSLKITVRKRKLIALLGFQQHYNMIFSAWCHYVLVLLDLSADSVTSSAT